MPITTAEELLRAGDVGRCELVRGTLRMMVPPGFEHGRITIRLTGPILRHVEAHGLGTVVAAETGFLLSRNPDTVRAPDIGFVRVSRGPGPARGYFPGAPDLAVEVLSPSTRRIDLTLKRSRYEAAGCPSYWVVDPDEPSLTAWELRGGEYAEVARVVGDQEFAALTPYAVRITPIRLLD